MEENKTNLNEAPGNPLGDYLLRTKSVSQRAGESGQLFPYYARGLEKALAQRAASLYGPEGAMRGALGGALAGAIGAQFMGKKGKTKKISALKVGGKALSGGALGGLIGTAIGTYDPETGMALPFGAGALALGGLGRKGYTSVKNRMSLPSRAQIATNQSMRGTRFYRSNLTRAISPEAREAAQKSAAAYGGALGSVAAVLAGKFYGYQSDRFEKAKRGETDPYLGTAVTSPGIPGYSAF